MASPPAVDLRRNEHHAPAGGAGSRTRPERHARPPAVVADAPGTRPRADSVRRNFIAMFLGQGLSWILTSVTIALLSRYFGPAQLGVFSLGTTLQSLGIVVAGLGFQTFIAKELARDPDTGGALVGTVLWTAAGLGVLAALGGSAAGIALTHGWRDTAVVAISCVAIPLMLVNAILSFALRGLQLMRYPAVADVATKVLCLAALVTVAVLDLGPIPFVVAVGVTPLLIAIPLGILVQRVLGRSLLTFSFPGAVRMARSSLPFWAAALLLTTNGSLDVLLLSALAGETATGIFAPALRILGTLLFVPMIVTAVIFPRVVDAYHQRSPELQRTTRVAMEVVVATSFPIMVATVAFSDSLLVPILGDDFEKSSPVLIVLALGLVPTAMTMVAGTVAMATARQGRWTLMTLVTLLVKLAALTVAIPLFDRHYGNPALGAAAVLFATEVGQLVMTLVVMRGCYLDRATLATLGRLSGAALAALAAGMAGLLAGGSLAGGVAACTVYGAGVFFFRAYRVADIRTAVRYALGAKAARQGVPA